MKIGLDLLYCIRYYYSMIRKANSQWKAPQAPLRSSMALLANVKKQGKLWSRTDAIRSVRAERDRADLILNFRTRTSPSATTVRFAVVTRFKKYFHVVGVGKIRTESFANLKKNLAKKGYTHIRMGGVKFAL